MQVVERMHGVPRSNKGKHQAPMVENREMRDSWVLIVGFTRLERVQAHQILCAKIDARARKYVFVGYDPNGKGWRCMDPKTLKVVTSRDVVFDETSSYYVQPILTKLADQSNDENEDAHDKETPSATNMSHGDSESESEATHEENNETHRSDHPPRRSQRTRKRNERYTDYTIGAEYDKIMECFFAGPVDESEPSSYEDAKGNPDWEVAMKEEISALHKNET
ncbi:hypothetical protein AgCh_019701 [Apium graveolens]